jgi:uncharacterized GH25 family protein
MKLYRYLILATLLMLAFNSTSFAHALWIEAEPQGALGKSHAVKIFYGEYAEKEFEKTNKWYSDVNTFLLWLVAPDGKKVQLSYSEAGDHYMATFIPNQDGVYILTTSHNAKEVDGGYIYQFNASAAVTVGKSKEVARSLPGNELYLEPVKNSKGKSGIVKAYYKGQPAADITITVFGPAGWSKNFKTDKNGVLEIEPLWKGTYALEGFYTSRETGSHFNVAYEHIWRCATLRLDLSN